MERVRRFLDRVVRVDHPDPDVRRRGETGIAVMLVLAVALVASAPVFAFLPGPVAAVASVLSPLPFLAVFVVWCRRGHVDRAAIGLGLVLWLAVVGQAVVTGDPSANLFYAAVVAVICLFMLPPHLHAWVFAGIGVAVLVAWATSSDSRSVPLGRGDLLVNGAVVALATAAVTVIGARRLAASQRAERRAVELSVRDPLTGLHNRRHLDDVVPELVNDAVRTGRPLAVALADIDHFKAINDDWSYAVGDDVLRRFAAVVTATCRADDLVARFGGEEFLVAMPDTDLGGAIALCDRVRRRVENVDWESVAPGLRVTVSFGVAASHEECGRSPEALMDAVDSRLHAAKRRGRNRVTGVA